MRNPLNKRLPKELKSELGKYIAIFIFFAGIISLVSGFLVADDSMISAYNKSFDKYNIEDGNFELMQEADDELISRLEQEELSIYHNFYKEESVKETEGTLRIYENRKDVDLVCVMDGELPDQKDEIAIDRMHAENNNLKVGDTVEVDGRTLTISGLVALSDYSALFSNNSDMMFDAIKFGVAVMTPEGFDAFGDSHIHYNYSWIYDEQPENDVQAKEKSEDFMKVLAQNAVIMNYIPEYLNQSIHFTGNDMGSDKGMFTMFLYVVVVIIAFVFAVTTANTLTKEASVIGTLRASGYSRRELVGHYLTLPMLVVLVDSIVGNILGYTLLKNFFASMYYGSYSLPTYVTIWNVDALIRTTVIPLVIMFLINLMILTAKLHLSPLQFLRRDLTRKKKRRAVNLPERMKFFSRFRFRIIRQNSSNYFTLFLGILFANFIMMFGLFFSPMINHYADTIQDSMISDYQYILKMPVETTEATAEKFSAETLKTIKGKYQSEDVTVYGFNNNSEYVDLDFHGNQVYVSDGYAAKYHLKAGDVITLKESYGDEQYSFTIQGIYDYPASLAIFMNQKVFQETFGEDEGYYNGYLSKNELEDIDDKYVATCITQDDLTKLSRQLQVSMGGMMGLFTVFGVVMAMLLIYLLSKLVIERNAQSISMAKILGYTDQEINRLYITATTVVFMISLVIAMPICDWLMEKLLVVCFADIPGWLPYYLAPKIIPEMLGLSIICYLVVLLFQMRKIKKIPKSDALKNVE